VARAAQGAGKRGGVLRGAADGAASDARRGSDLVARGDAQARGGPGALSRRADGAGVAGGGVAAGVAPAGGGVLLQSPCGRAWARIRDLACGGCDRRGAVARLAVVTRRRILSRDLLPTAAQATPTTRGSPLRSAAPPCARRARS